MSKQDFSALVQTVAERERGDHPDPDVLLSHALGELDAASAEEVVAHLGQCPECTRAVLDLSSFPALEPADGVAAVGEDEVEALWQSVSKEVGLSSDSAVTASPSPAPIRSFDRWIRIAAVFFFATTMILLALLLGDRGAGEDDDGKEWSSTQVGLNVPILPLRPMGEGPVDRSSPEVERRAVAPTAEGILLQLRYPELSPHPSYQAVLRLDDREIYSTRDLERTPEGLLTLSLPREVLAPGLLTVELSGIVDGATTPLGTFAVKLGFD